jgi:thiol:disulfide interchange protein DsbD
MVTPPDPPSRLYWWVVALAGICAGGWLAWRTPIISKKYFPRIIFCVIGGLIIWFSGFIGVRMTSKGPIDWVYYTPERFAAAVAEKKVIMLDFTAEWCLNCKTLEATSLSQDEVVELTEVDAVIPMKIDLTGNNPDGRAKLAEENRLTILLIVIYGKDGVPVFKSDAYTGNQVVKAIKNAAETIGIPLESAAKVTKSTSQ